MMKKIMIVVLIIAFAGNALVGYCLCKAASRGDRFIRVNRREEEKENDEI